MRNHRGLVCCLLVLALLPLAGQSVCAQAPQSPAVTVNLLPVGFETVVRELPVKPTPPMQIDGRKVHPFTNLDIFLKYTLAIGSSSLPQGVVIPKPDISVWIPFKYIIARTGLKADDVRHMDLAFWNAATGTWESVFDLKDEVSGYVKDAEAFRFRIVKWPIDDRLSGCY